MRGNNQEQSPRTRKIRGQNEALMRLARSRALSRGHLKQALREITEMATATLEVARTSIWLYDDKKTCICCQDLYQLDQRVHESGTTLSASDYPAYFQALKTERCIPAYDAHTHPATHEFSADYLTPLGIGAMLDAPIFVAGAMVGVICNEHVGGPRKWSLDDEQFAGSIADMAALALESSKRIKAQVELQAAVKQLKQQLGAVNALVDVSTSLVSVLDVNAVLEKIIDLSKEVAHAEASSLLLLEPDGRSLRFHVTRGPAAEKLSRKKMRLGQGLAGWVAKEGKPLLVADAYQDPRFDPAYDRITGLKTQSIMTVPLRTKDKVLGVLQVLNKVGQKSFDERDLNLFQSFASLGGIALDNAQLFAQTRKMAEELRDALEKERRLSIEKEKMGAYIPKRVVDEISRNREQKLALGGKTIRGTVLFADIKGFTRVSENMKPQAVVAFLNEYMTTMTKVIEEEGGIVDKFIGDGIMAVFLPENRNDNHALRGVRCGIRMQQMLKDLKACWKVHRPHAHQLEMRCGINSGEMVAGNVGSETRMEYTVIGDNVNVASRIEANGVGGSVHISHATYQAVKKHVAAAKLGAIQVKNRKRPVQIYSVEIPKQRLKTGKERPS